MNNTLGGFGNNQSNNIWFKYQAVRETDGKKEPFAKLCVWDKEKKKDDEYSWLAGELQSVQYRLNDGNADHNVDPYHELLLTLRGVDSQGKEWFYKLPLRASGIAAFGVARRLHHFTHGDLIHIGTGVLDDQPTLWVQAVSADGQRIKLEPVNPGIEFMKYDGLTGEKLKLAKGQNAAMREEWVEQTVKGLSFYTDQNTSTRTYESVQNTVSSIAGQAPTPPDADTYDPFADE